MERRAVVLLSGGLDSATAAALARRDGDALYGLTVRYGQVHACEVAAARRVAAGRAQELFEDLPMQQRVAAGYDAVCAELAAAGERIEILDGERPMDEVAAAIRRLVDTLTGR